jgi:glycosyltransferase involved in cell wall biosynthesis
MVKLSLIVPVFNRPEEIQELLQSLVVQSNKQFEILIIEDGSMDKCDRIVSAFEEQLDVKYFFKENSGPGTTRNYGCEKATGNYFIFLDSDIIVPEEYIQIVLEELNGKFVDAFGGPDRAHPSFSNLQKAINYSMTSIFTTGGIRGSKKAVDVFYPRSFNMGISEVVFNKTGGFSEMRFGEDLDFSMRILEQGFATRLFPDAFVYHKRRNNLRTFFKQINNSGIARINLYKRHPETLKLVHFFPAIFTLGLLLLILLSILRTSLFLLPLAFMAILFFADAAIRNRSITVGFLSVFTSFEQFVAYGSGFIKAFWKRIVLGKPEFHHFKKNFYK